MSTKYDLNTTYDKEIRDFNSRNFGLQWITHARDAIGRDIG